MNRKKSGDSEERRFIKLLLKIRNNWVSDDPQHLAMWVHTLLNTQWEPNSKLNPGEVLLSIRWLAEKGKCSHNKAHRFLKRCLDENMVVLVAKEARRIEGRIKGRIERQIAGRKASVYKVTRFNEIHQLDNGELDELKDELRDESRDESGDTLEREIKRENKREGGCGGEKKDSLAQLVDRDPGFQKFWAAYPRQTAKKRCREWWIKNKPSDALVEEMLKAISEQKRSDQWQEENGKYIPYPSTWLNGEKWHDKLKANTNGGRSLPFAREEQTLGSGLLSPKLTEKLPPELVEMAQAAYLALGCPDFFRLTLRDYPSEYLPEYVRKQAHRAGLL